MRYQRFARFGLAFFAIVFFLPLLNSSYIYAGNADSMLAEAEAYRAKGYEAQQRGEIDSAIEWYQKAASLTPNYASPHNDLGILFETKGWLDRAEAEYQKALTIDPGYKEVHTNLALLYERKGDLEKAAFHWMRRYKLGIPGDPWTQEAKNRLEKLGLIDKIESPVQKIKQEPVKKIQKIERPVVKKEAPVRKVRKPAENKSRPEPKVKKDSGWTRIGPAKDEKPAEISNKYTGPAQVSKKDKSLDAELQESLRLAEERLKKEKAEKEKPADVKKTTDVKAASDSEASVSYVKARDYYNKGEYVKALDTIRIARQGSPQNKPLLDMEEEVKVKMKEDRIEDHYKEGMIRYRQKDFAGSRKEFESILSILPE